MGQSPISLQIDLPGRLMEWCSKDADIKQLTTANQQSKVGL